MNKLLNTLFTSMLVGAVMGAAMATTLEILDLRARVDQLERGSRPVFEPLILPGEWGAPILTPPRSPAMPICPTPQRKSC